MRQEPMEMLPCAHAPDAFISPEGECDPVQLFRAELARLEVRIDEAAKRQADPGDALGQIVPKLMALDLPGVRERDQAKALAQRAIIPPPVYTPPPRASETPMLDALRECVRGITDAVAIAGCVVVVLTIAFWLAERWS
jgi:hypothetical protein